MIHVTPHNKHYTYTNQDCDERQALLCDLQKSPDDYLTHKDPVVRNTADWALKYAGLRRIRAHFVQQNEQDANGALRQLYRRLRLLACTGMLALALLTTGCGVQWGDWRSPEQRNAAFLGHLDTFLTNISTPPLTTTCTTRIGTSVVRTRCTTY